MPAGTIASNGPPEDCTVDKIEQFKAELVADGTDAEERVVALKFILNFIGDLHQPLHSADKHDQGGNEVKVRVAGFAHSPKDELHGFWDTQFVDDIAMPASAPADQLLARITPDDARTWARGTPADWALEAFTISKSDAYSSPPLGSHATARRGIRECSRSRSPAATEPRRYSSRFSTQRSLWATLFSMTWVRQVVETIALVKTRG
jgi:hypothetical protein